jgi:Mor family transcriptional regulator
MLHQELAEIIDTQIEQFGTDYIKLDTKLIQEVRDIMEYVAGRAFFIGYTEGHKNGYIEGVENG